MTTEIREAYSRTDAPHVRVGSTGAATIARIERAYRAGQASDHRRWRVQALACPGELRLGRCGFCGERV